MRFRELELIRYGGFADRVLRFGGGRPDLHLVVGPNEAGKSTTLQAIGDFLFGIGGQTPQGWRWGYGDLRLRAVLEHEGRTVEAVRRKGNKDTLLGPDGAPLAGDPLAAVLAGVDRAAFERMFGLDHRRLREGGQAILLNSDDAARITLEAGSGIAGVGRVMDGLEAMAAELFKAGGSKPEVNRLMAERAAAQKRVRETVISDADWTDRRRQRTEAEERRDALIVEGDQLEREAARVDRIGRARAPLSRLRSAQAELDALGPAPDLPADASERVSRARTERQAARELEERHRMDLGRTGESAAGLSADPTILSIADRIVALDERRPVIEKGGADLKARLVDRARSDERLDAARAEAGLAAGSPLPSAGWRRRAAEHLAERREAAVGTRAAAERRAELVEAVRTAERRLVELADVPDSAAVEAAVAAVPADVAARIGQLAEEEARKRVRADGLLAALRPWTGDAGMLAALELPGPGAAAEAARALEAARVDALAARREADAQEREAIRAESRLQVLAAGGDLPSAEVVAAARADRDRLLGQVLSGDLAQGGPLRDAVTGADALADRRDAEAERVAEHAQAVAARDGARALERAARALMTARGAEAERLEEAWAARLTSLGFGATVPPADFAAWLDARARALEAEREARQAADAAIALSASAERTGLALRQALQDLGAAPAAGADGGGAGLEELAAAARALMKRAAEAAVRRERLEAALADAQRELATAERVAAREREAAAERDAVLAMILDEVGLAAEGGERVLGDALAALELVAGELAQRPGLERQIAALEREAAAFDADVGETLGLLGRASADRPVQEAAALGAELRDATAARDRLDALDGERVRLGRELEGAERRRVAAEAELDGLMRRAGASDDAALDRAVEAVRRRATLDDMVVADRTELAALDDAAGTDALAAAVAELSADEETAARARIEDRRRTLAAEREEVGGRLAAAEEAFGRAARARDAADAQQEVAETGAALGAAAERHVEAATAAALLRWALDRHRQRHQAPLIARAGALFATVSDGAFTGLGVDYGEDDRPVIRAVRADGSRLGAEALSEGTRDQLFLALRLGSIAAGAHALPIVCDDLLITADDARAAAMLRVLGAASARNQVILFTHHHHLIEVARDAVGEDGFVLHRLEAAALAA